MGISSLPKVQIGRHLEKGELIEILPEFFQNLARALPLVHIFEEARHILVDNVVNYGSIITAFKLNLIYLVAGIFLFYYSFSQARKTGSLINIGE